MWLEMAPAKINLFLRILGKPTHGYHQVETVYTQLSLSDTITFEELPSNRIEVRCDDVRIPRDETNLAYQAAQLIKTETNCDKGIRLEIEKHIPAGAGLGGGSSDAAAVLRGLNNGWQLGSSEQELKDLAKQLGSDVAYHLVGGVKAEIQGGEQGGEFTDLPSLPACYVVLVVPDLQLSSKEAYGQVRYDLIGKTTLQPLVQALEKQDMELVGQSLSNDFELWTLDQYPLLRRIKADLLANNATAALLSGKGSAVFGLYNDKHQAYQAAMKLKSTYNQVWVVEPYVIRRVND